MILLPYRPTTLLYAYHPTCLWLSTVIYWGAIIWTQHCILHIDLANRTAWVASIVPWGRTPWVAGQLWRAPTDGMDAFMSMLLILSSYEQKTQTVEIFDVLKTVLTRAILTTKYSRQLIFGFNRCQPWLRKTRRPTNHPKCPSPGDVIPPKMSYN